MNQSGYHGMEVKCFERCSVGNQDIFVFLGSGIWVKNTHILHLNNPLFRLGKCIFIYGLSFKPAMFVHCGVWSFKPTRQGVYGDSPK